MFIFIADISGYTHYMIKNQREIEHGKLSISFLIESLVKAIDLPIEISKLEGDSILMFLRKEKIKDHLWLQQKLFLFFSVFEKKLQELQISTTCPCGACNNINQLKLKIIGHFGKAKIEKIGHFEELSGLDVDIVYHLLKNHVPSHRYLLLTEPAYERIEISDSITVSKMEEKYEDVGVVSTFVFDPPEVPYEELPQRVTVFSQLCHMTRMKSRGMLVKMGFKQLGIFHNLPK